MRGNAEPKLIAGNANKELAQQISNCIQNQHDIRIPLTQAKVERFNDEEVFVEVFENVRGGEVFIIQSTSKPANDHLMEILIMSDAVSRSSASLVTAVIPYFGYARQDRKTKARTPISAKLVANLIAQAGVTRVLTMDLHSAQVQGFFDIPVDNLYASPIFALEIMDQFRADLKDIVVVSPDLGGVSRARELGQRIDAPLAVINKQREIPGQVTEMTLIGDVMGRICILVDDICDTAGTLCAGADLLLSSGAREVHAFVTHGVLSNSAVDRVNKSRLKSMVITDTIEPKKPVRDCGKIRILPIAPMFAQAILNILERTSVSSLFKQEKLGRIYSSRYPFAAPALS